MKAYLSKKAIGVYSLEDIANSDALAKLPYGAVICVEWKRPRNYKFLKKYYALLNLAFDAWEPDAEYKGERVAKNFEQFRNDCTVLAGFYDATVTLGGQVRMVAKSISFGKMEESEFDKLYNATVNVILARILKNYTRDDIDRVIDNLLAFT